MVLIAKKERVVCVPHDPLMGAWKRSRVGFQNDSSPLEEEGRYGDNTDVANGNTEFNTGIDIERHDKTGPG